MIGNDGISANLSDRHFSSQVRLGVVTKKIPKPFQKYITDKNYIVMTLTHEIYTPEDIESFELVEDDRPYAGWLYLTLGSIKQTKKQLEMLTYDIGFVGPSAQAERLQQSIHGLIGSDDPKGWQHQLGDEFTINANYDHYFSSKLELSDYISAELIRFYGVSLGNVRTQIRAGDILRLGQNLPHDLKVGVNKNKNEKCTIYSILKLEGKYILSDIFLDGNWNNESHSVEPLDLVAQASAGITIKKKGFGFSIVQFVQSKEFKGQDTPDTNAQIRFDVDFIK